MGVGNEFFRSVIRQHKFDYTFANQAEKKNIIMRIINKFRSRNTRFLKLDPATNMWYDIGNQNAFKKIRQALIDQEKIIIPDPNTVNINEENFLEYDDECINDFLMVSHN